jgi:transposase
MRYELSDYEWTAVKPMLPNKPRAVRRVNDRRGLNGIFSVLLTNDVTRASWIRCGLDQGACPPARRMANIPPKRNRKDRICSSPHLYRARNLIERFFNKIKQCRRVATRYDKLAANYLAFVKLASIRIWLRANESTL